MLRAGIAGLACYLPNGVLENEELSEQFPDWSPSKIYAKTGVRRRHLVGPGEFTSDLAVQAACRLFDGGACLPEEVDYLILCTQSPDYLLPTTGCLIQDRLGLSRSCGALDFNLGCSGYVYGLGLAKGLIETEQATNVLLLTAETYTRFLDPSDRTTRSLFGDAAAATLIRGINREDPLIGPFAYGTDGAGGSNLIVRAGALRHGPFACAEALNDGAGFLSMNGPEIFAFTLRCVPEVVGRVLEKAEKSLEEIDLFVFHQANAFMLEHLREKLDIPPDRFVVRLEEQGNTVSSSIPIALQGSAERGFLRPGQLVMLVGFGVGYSWGATLVRWADLGIQTTESLCS